MSSPDYLADVVAFDAARREAIIYGLLCRWVSEVEPEVVYQQTMNGPDRIVGLRRAGGWYTDMHVDVACADI